MNWWLENCINDLLSSEKSIVSVAMSFFNAIGHTCTYTALFSDIDPLHFVYGTLATKVALSPSDRNALMLVKEISLLFKIDGSVFDNTQCDAIFYFAVDLSVPIGARSSVASEIQLLLSRIAEVNTVVLFRNEDEYMLSFTVPYLVGRERVVLSDWFCVGSHSDSYYEAFAAFNFSFASSTAFYDDFRHAAARQYYKYTGSFEFALYEVLPALLNESEERDYLSRDDIIAMVRNILLEPFRAYGDDYVDIKYSVNYSTDEPENNDFDLLEYELEQIGAFGVDYQDESFDDEAELTLQSGDCQNFQIDSDSIPADIMCDPVKLLTWLEEHEGEKNREEKHQPAKLDNGNSEDLLTETLDLEDLDYIDNRNKGGVFWIIGGPEIASFIAGLSEKTGYIFTFKAGGGRVTTGEDAWWMR